MTFKAYSIEKFDPDEEVDEDEASVHWDDRIAVKEVVRHKSSAAEERVKGAYKTVAQHGGHVAAIKQIDRV